MFSLTSRLVLRLINPGDQMHIVGPYLPVSHPNVKTTEPLMDDLQILALVEIQVEYEKDDFVFTIEVGS
jgi:hypothetical protein